MGVILLYDTFWKMSTGRKHPAGIFCGEKEKYEKRRASPNMKNTLNEKKPNGLALIPFVIFIVIYMGAGIYYQAKGTKMAFYQFPSVTAMFVAVLVAFIMFKGTINEKFEVFAKGAANVDILTMLMIYILAGAFAQVAANMGGRESTVNLGLSLVPVQFLAAGLFVISAFMGTATGSSMGTVSAVIPIAVGIAEKGGLSLTVVIGAVVGGAMFGDNLSMISDTTIAATRTQGCEMGDKFRMNFLIVLPAALLTVALLWFSASGGTEVTLHDFELIRVLPYIAVLVLALTGLNAFIVLATGILLSGLVGLFCGIPGADGQIVPYSLLRWGQDIYKGFTGMNEIMVLSMLIGGLGELIRYHGGIAWLLARVDGLARRLAGKSGGKGSSRVGESCIALLASLADICTANNTVAIILTGGLAREIALKNGIDPRRSASLLDIFSCVFQGLIPWAAQLLLAGSLAKISPLEITINNWYCMLLAVAGILAIILGLPRIKARSTEA